MEKTISRYFSRLGQKGGTSGKGKKMGGIWTKMTKEEKSERMKLVRQGKKISD